MKGKSESLRRNVRQLKKTAWLPVPHTERTVPKGYWRPKRRCDCAKVPRPCPYVGCRYHLYLDVDESTGAITFRFPRTPVSELRESCALDVADRGEHRLQEIGDFLRVSREYIRQIEERGLKKMLRSPVIKKCYEESVECDIWRR